MGKKSQINLWRTQLNLPKLEGIQFLPCISGISCNSIRQVYYIKQLMTVKQDSTYHKNLTILFLANGEVFDRSDFLVCHPLAPSLWLVLLSQMPVNFLNVGIFTVLVSFQSQIIHVLFYVCKFGLTDMPLILRAEAEGLECLTDQDCLKQLQCKNPKCICQCNDQKGPNAGDDSEGPAPADIPPCRFQKCPIPGCKNPSCGCLCGI